MSDSLDAADTKITDTDPPTAIQNAPNPSANGVKNPEIEVESLAPDSTFESMKWICPMCIGVASPKPGNCRKCGLAMEPSAVLLDASSRDPELRSMMWRLKLSLVLGLPLLVMSIWALSVEESYLRSSLGPKWYIALQAILCTPVVLICGKPIIARAWRSIRTVRPNVFTLSGLGMGAAYLFSLVALVYVWIDLPLLKKPIGKSIKLKAEVAEGLEVLAPSRTETVDLFFDAAAVIVILTLLGQVLELRARSRTGVAIRKLVQNTPKTARVVLPDGRFEDRPLEEVRPGDLVQVGPSQQIPVDGIVREGTSTVDESLLTGEAMRAGRGPGMSVTAGTDNGLGVLTIETLRVKGDTILAHIIALIDRALQNRIPLQRTVDRIVAWFLPIVVMAACATFGGWALYGPPDSLSMAAACAVGVLVVSCPVALGLATPIAVTIGMARAARAGILFRDGAAVERLHSVTAIIFDKTGTLTEGKMKLIGAEPNHGVTPDELLALAAAVERGNEHPISLAIVWAAASRGLKIAIAEGVESIPGKGVRGLVDGRRIVVGRIAFLQEVGADQEMMVAEANTQRATGKGVIFVGRDERCIGIIVLEDPIRANAREATATLLKSAVRLVLVTGDHADSAKGVARMVGIGEVIADTLPVEKYAIVQRLKNEGYVVAMCGDGINDAPALAAADVGIAMGTGSEAAITIAGVALVRPDLRAVAHGRELSRMTVRTIRQNLLLAFVFTLAAVPLAAGILIPFGGGLFSPILGALAMAISSLAILGNSLRLARQGANRKAKAAVE